MTDTQGLILAAQNAIGEGDSTTDWKIVPTEHAKLFAEQSAQLAQVLRGSRLQGLAKQYEELNLLAVESRDQFKHTLTKANTAVFCAASLGALLLVAAGLQGSMGRVGPWVAGVIGFLGVVFGALATMWLTQVRGGGLANKWTKERAAAEAKRLAYFKEIMERVSDQPSDQLLAFEYTRRFLLDNQIDYFRDRGGQHGLTADRALKTGTQAIFVASTVTAVAGVLSMWQPRLAIVAGIAVIASAYAALVGSRTSVNLDRRNADRYRLAKDQLEDRKMGIDDYRKKVESGDKAAVQEFFEPIFVTLTTDHKEFLNDKEQREMAIGAMAARLDAANEAPRRRPDHP